MNINVSIKSDEKLRNEVMKVIKGQVTSIMRKELKAIIIEVVSGDKSKKLTPERMEKLLTDEIKEHVKQAVNENWYKDDRKKLEGIIHKEVYKYIQTMDKKIDDAIINILSSAINDRLTQYINEEADKKIKRYISTLLAK